MLKSPIEIPAFASLGQRVVYSYLITLPAFVPYGGCGVPVESQRSMASFIRNLLTRVYEDPELIGIPSYPDDCYENWMLYKTKPDLQAQMLKVDNKLQEFIILLLDVGSTGTLSGDALCVPNNRMKVAPKHLRMMQNIGLAVEKDSDGVSIHHPQHTGMMDAWKALAMVEPVGTVYRSGRVSSFLTLRFDNRCYTAQQRFDSLIDDKTQLIRLEAFFAEKGYELKNPSMHVEWELIYRDKERGYLRVGYDFHRRDPLSVAFHVPRFRQLLDRFAALAPDMQAFIFQHTKTCDNCRYCVQTDKTNKRPLLARHLRCSEGDAIKCPLYPFFDFRSFDPSMFDMMLRIFAITHDSYNSQDW